MRAALVKVLDAEFESPAVRSAVRALLVAVVVVAEPAVRSLLGV